jgi:hypothetical protein
VVQVWESIETVVSRRELRAAVVPAPETDPDGDIRAVLVGKIATMRGFLPMLCEHIEFAATTQAQPVLAAMREIRGLIKAAGPPSNR